MLEPNVIAGIISGVILLIISIRFAKYFITDSTISDVKDNKL
jgi:hypothetical protein